MSTYTYGDIPDRIRFWIGYDDAPRRDDEDDGRIDAWIADPDTDPNVLLALLELRPNDDWLALRIAQEAPAQAISDAFVDACLRHPDRYGWLATNNNLPDAMAETMALRLLPSCEEWELEARLAYQALEGLAARHPLPEPVLEALAEDLGRSGASEETAPYMGGGPRAGAAHRILQEARHLPPEYLANLYEMHRGAEFIATMILARPECPYEVLLLGASDHPTAPMTRTLMARQEFNVDPEFTRTVLEHAPLDAFPSQPPQTWSEEAYGWAVARLSEGQAIEVLDTWLTEGLNEVRAGFVRPSLLAPLLHHTEHEIRERAMTQHLPRVREGNRDPSPPSRAPSSAGGRTR